MGRPRTFDLDDAVDKAMNLFWRDGYEGAGLAELLAVMGIQRGSLYKAFGSKRGLFLAALNRYVAKHVDPGIDYLINGPGPGLERVAQVMANAPVDNRGIGCLLCNTAAGSARDDPDIRMVVNSQLDRIRNAFATALADSATGDRVSETRADRLTREYVGLQVGTRSGWQTGRPT